MLACTLIVLIALIPAASMAAGKSYLECVTDALGAIEEGRTSDSLQSLNQAMTVNANDSLAHTALGLTLMCGSRPGDAAGEFKAAAEMDESCAEAIYGLGLVSLGKGDIPGAVSLLCKAQTTKPDLDMQGTIEYAKALAGGAYTAKPGDHEDECIDALKALALMKDGKYADAKSIWIELQKKAVRPGMGERIGCAAAFAKSSPVILTGYPVTNRYVPPSTVRSKLPVVSGDVNLKADLSRAQAVDMVSFFVDGKLVGVTNTSPFCYSWHTSSVANGSHIVKVEGYAATGEVISEKSTEVLVKNKGAAVPSERVTGAEADKVWARLWADLVLKPSAAMINYNLAICALKLGDADTAEAALERVMAADPDFPGARNQLAVIRRADGSYTKIYRVNTSRKVVALTFDDGPKSDTGRLLDVLKAKGVKATFFVVGKQVDTYPDTLKRMAAEGHEIENHTYNHRDLEYLSDHDITQEFFKDCATVRALTGKPTHYLRPPGGHEGKRLPGVMKEFGIPAVYWTTNCGSAEGTTKKKMVNLVVNSAKPGSVFLMHNLELVTLNALPDIIDTLRAKGYEFETLMEMQRADSGRTKK